MFIKSAKFKLKIKPKKAIKSLAIFLLITSWLLTGWPGMQLGSNQFFPPRVQGVRADTIADSTPGTVASVADAGTGCTNATTTDWGTMINTETSDDAYAIYGSGNFFDASEVSEEFQLSNFGISIPNGSTINGVTVGIERKGTSADVQDRNVNLTKTAGVQIGANKAVAADWGTTDATATYGSGSDLWGTTWSEAEIEATGFGLVICVQTLAGDTNAIASIDLITITVTYTPPPTTTLGADSSNDPVAVTVAPGSGIRSSGQFTFTTSSGTDTVTALTLTLAEAPAGSYAAIDSVSIRATSCAGTLYFSAVTPSSDSVSFSGGTALSATTGGNTYLVCVTPKDHTLASGTYSVSPYVSATWTSGNGNTKAGTDSNANALTIDNTAPNGATSTSGSGGNTAVTLNWTTSNSSDFNTTGGSVVYRWLGSSAGSEVPAEGSAPSSGDANGTATAACVISSSVSTAQSKIDGTGGSTGCTTTALTNGQAYTYKVFQKDNYGNYDAGVSIGTFTPSAATSSFTQNKYRWYYDNDLINPTTAWGAIAIAENTAIPVIPAGYDPPNTTQELRLRVNLVVNTAALSVSSKYFKLEYKAGTDGSCTTGSWTDIGTSVWTYATSGVADGGNITASLSDTTTGKGEQYVKAKPSALNNVGANIGEIVEYDFHVIGGTATPNTTYSFRVVETNSGGTTETVLDTYTNCPTITTEPGTADLMRHGNVFTNSIKQGFFWAN